VDDVAEIAVASGRSMTSTTLDAIGPEAFSFKQLIRVIAKNIRPNVKLIHVRPALGIALGRVIGLPLRDILLTRDELRGLMDGLLTSDQQPNGIRRFSQWMETYHREVGSAYASELGRHFRWSRSL
jgi:NADH dehydrogenase